MALKGPIGTPVGGGFQSANVTLRQSLELFACMRPVKTIAGLTSRFSGVDLVTVRENAEGLYSGLEHRVAPGVVESPFWESTARSSKRCTAVHPTWRASASRTRRR